ncbi:MAG: hypothetical protein AAF960_15580 [Bacteroidota bacterium]
MKLKKYLLGVLTFFCSYGLVHAQVTYSLRYDGGTEVYTLSMTSTNAYSGALARITASTQATLVFPHTTGGFQITDLTDLQTGGTPLDWGFSRLDAPAENSAADYLFFAPNNATTYTLFSIPAGTAIDLFSFKSGSGCIGDVALFDNTNDPLNTNSGLNPDNNFVVLGGGLGNQYTGNTSGNVACSTPVPTEVTYCINYDSGSQTYTVSMESNQAYTGGLARLSSATQITIVAPATAGGFQITNLMGLQAGGTPLDWGFSRLDAPAENAAADYLFFAPSNATTYTPFDITANTNIPLFSFQSGSGCLGDIQLFDNTNDSLNANTGLNPDNNVTILGAGLGNKYIGNNVACTSASCATTCTVSAGVLSY